MPHYWTNVRTAGAAMSVPATTPVTSRPRYPVGRRPRATVPVEDATLIGQAVGDSPTLPGADGASAFAEPPPSCTSSDAR